MSDFEPQFDAQLRNVPVPDGLLGRLRGVAAWSDEEIDHALGAVTMPLEFVLRLKQVPADEVLDEELREVPVPIGLGSRLQSRWSRRTMPKWVGDLSRAASLFLFVGGSCFAVLFVILSPLRETAADSFARHLIDVGPLELAARIDSTAPETYLVGDEMLIIAERSDVVRAQEIVLAATLAEFEAQRLDVPSQTSDESIQRGPAGEFARALRAGLNPGRDLLLLRWGVLGAPSRADDELPELESVPVSLKRGIPPPLVQGFDRAFLFRHRVQPITPLNAHPSLARIAVPLVTHTTSFDLADRLVKQRRQPATDDIRVEEFLAAMNYGLPAVEPGELALFVAGGPSPFGDDGARLLQIAVKAGPVRTRTNVATHLTVALDVSASMQWGGRLELARQALSQLVRQLGPRDRFSLLVFNEEATPLVEGASHADRESVQGVLESLRADGGTNLASALQQAVWLSQNVTEADVARRLVLITDDAGQLPAETAARVNGLLASASADGTRLSVLDLGGRRQTATELQQLATSGRGDMRGATNVEEIHWGLWETLTGDSGMVAMDATLRVSFNPKHVVAYRLLGHEATSYGGLLPAAVPSALRANQAATALFEIWLAPNAGSDLATAELQWTDADTGPAQQRRRTITREDLATSFAESPASLQAAALAAETAEVLRDSYFVPSRSRNLRGVLQGVSQVHSELRGQPEFQRFVRLVRQAEQLRGGR